MGGLFKYGAVGTMLNQKDAGAPKSGIKQVLDPAGAIGGTTGGIIDSASLLRNDTKETLLSKPKPGLSLLRGE